MVDVGHVILAYTWLGCYYGNNYFQDAIHTFDVSLLSFYCYSYVTVSPRRWNVAYYNLDKNITGTLIHCFD